jgi:hypothetical protein
VLSYDPAKNELVSGAMPTDVFGRGHVIVGYQHGHEDVAMAPTILSVMSYDRSFAKV